MNNLEREKIIKILKVLLETEDMEIIHCTIESLIEELKERGLKKLSK